ncbi:MAG: hypothetical protein IKH28_08540 [Lachnospiraceae bacterium]|nr:hypothetical protein [Lachnospiraceae bacterium]
MRSFELKVKRTGYGLLAVIAFCVIFVCAPLRAKAAEVFTNGYFQYVVEDHSVKIVSYFGTQEEVTVPNMIAGNPVNEIAKDAFAGNQDVKKVNLPDTIMTIEEGAFGEGQTVVYDGADPADIATAITQIEAGAEGQGTTGSQGGTGSEEQGTAGGGSQAGTGAEGQGGTGSEGQGGAQTGTGSGSEGTGTGSQSGSGSEGQGGTQTGTGSGSEGTGSEGQGSTGAEGQGMTDSQSGTDEFTLEEFEVGTEDDDALLFANAETGVSGDGAAKEQGNASAADEKAQEQKAEIGADSVAVTVGTSEVANPKSHGMVVVLIVAAAVVLMGGCAAVTYIAKKDKGQKN